MTDRKGFIGVKEFNPDIKEIARSTNQLLLGKSNNVNTVTLAVNAASTLVTLSNGQLGTATVILFQPQTANAAGALATMYENTALRNVSAGKFTLEHANNSETDRTFGYILVG